MSIDRRRFLQSGSLAVLGSFVGAPWARGAAMPAAPRALDDAEAKVFEFIASYGRACRIVGGSVAGRTLGSPFRITNLLVDLPRASLFEAAMTAPDAVAHGGFASGNTLSFFVGERFFTVENLPSAAFTKRVADLKAGRGATFLHDSLSLDPATGATTDARRALATGALRFATHSARVDASFDAVLRGRTESGYWNLPLAADFQRYQSTLLTRVAPVAQTKGIAASLLARLPALSRVAPAAEIKALLLSKLVSTAMAAQFRVHTSGVVADFDALRASLPAAESDGAIWLAILLAPEIDAHDGSATKWLRGDRFSFLQAQADLKAARPILQTPAFARLQTSA